jgi:hypothetical protein
MRLLFARQACSRLATGANATAIDVGSRIDESRTVCVPTVCPVSSRKFNGLEGGPIQQLVVQEGD